MDRDHFVGRLAALRDTLEKDGFLPEEEFSALAVTLGSELSRTVVTRMLEAARRGTSEVEIVGAFPLALAFVVNSFLNAIDQCGDQGRTDRLFDITRHITHQLGEEDATRLRSALRPERCN
jgi:hypothetical protein